MSQQEQLALVVVDVLSDYDHPDAEQLMASVEETVPRTVALVEAAR
jgi:nicotinamidase-related amidase